MRQGPLSLFVSRVNGVTRLSHDCGNELVASVGLQAHSFSAQQIVHWGVEVGPNQNQESNDLIFCSINTFLLGSGAIQQRWPSLCNLALRRELLTVTSHHWSDRGQRAHEINFLWREVSGMQFAPLNFLVLSKTILVIYFVKEMNAFFHCFSCFRRGMDDDPSQS